jgi:hypothetical protein
MKELVQEMLQDGLVNEVTGKYTTKIIFAAALLGKLFLMVDLFYNYLRSTIKSKGQVFFDVSRVVKGGLIIFLIWMYYPFFGFIDYLIEAINGLTAMDLSEVAGKVKMGELGTIDAEEGLELLKDREILRADGSSIDIQGFFIKIILSISVPLFYHNSSLP